MRKEKSIRGEFERWLRTPPNEHEDGAFYVGLPFSELREWVPEGIHTETVNAFGLSRLEGIRALSFLSYIGPAPENQYFLNFNHTRFHHSLVVALVMEKILQQNNFDQNNLSQGTVAALVHDRGTPALGDATKSLDGKALDEELHWADELPQTAEEVIKKHGLKKEEIDNIIRNNGTLGNCLDVADRIAYVLIDAFMVAGMSSDTNPYINELTLLLRKDPQLGNIYQDVRIDPATGKVFFTNAKRLGLFLRLRALLHNKLYLHPVSAGRDLFVANLIRPLYSPKDNSLLTPSKLRRMTDDELLEKLFDHYQPSAINYLFFYSDLVKWYPQYLKVETEEEAAAKAEELQQHDNTVVIGIKQVRSFDPATSYNVTAGGKIVPFSQAHPKWARAIESIAQSTGGLFVFYADVSQGWPINELLKRIHAA